MPPLTAATPSRLGRTALALAFALVGGGGGVAACKPKASPAQCEQLIDRYAMLVVTAKYPDASAAQVETEREREKREARTDEAFKSCSSQVSQAEFECAMRALGADAFEKCLE